MIWGGKKETRGKLRVCYAQSIFREKANHSGIYPKNETKDTYASEEGKLTSGLHNYSVVLILWKFWKQKKSLITNVSKIMIARGNWVFRWGASI